MDFSVQELVNLLNSSDTEERLFALTYIARRNLQEVVVEVASALGDADPEVRAAAAWALDLLNNPQTIPALIHALRDENYHVRSTAGWALANMGDVAIPYVVEALRQDTNRDARVMALQILIRSNAPEAIAARAELKAKSD